MDAYAYAFWFTLGDDAPVDSNYRLSDDVEATSRQEAELFARERLTRRFHERVTLRGLYSRTPVQSRSAVNS